MDPENPDQTAPASTEQPSTPAGNLTAVEFALRRASRRAQPVPAATGTTPDQSPAPEGELAGGADPDSQDPEVPSQTPGASPDDPTQPEATSAPEIPSGSTVAQLIASAIKEAALQPDRATAVSKLVKRIAVLVDDRDAERNRRLELEQASKAQAQQPEPTTPQRRDVPQGDPRLTQIEGQIEQLNAALETIEQNPDGYTYVDEATKQERTVSAEELAKLRVKYDRQLVEMVTERRLVTREIEKETEAKTEAANAIAVQRYPWVRDKAAPEFQVALRELRELGPIAKELRKSPAFNLIMGRYVAGLQLEEAAAAKAQQPAVGRVPAPGARPKNGSVPPAVVAGSTNRGKAPAASNKLKAAEEEARTTGSPAAFAKLRSLRRQAAAAA